MEIEFDITDDDNEGREASTDAPSTSNENEGDQPARPQQQRQAITRQWRTLLQDSAIRLTRSQSRNNRSYNCWARLDFEGSLQMSSDNNEEEAASRMTTTTTTIRTWDGMLWEGGPDDPREKAQDTQRFPARPEES